MSVPHLDRDFDYLVPAEHLTMPSRGCGYGCGFTVGWSTGLS